MRIDMNGVVFSLSYALDCIEAEFVGQLENHSKWVAYLSSRMGRAYGLPPRSLSDLSACAALHDNALTQYLAEERIRGGEIIGGHCSLGEENAARFPFHSDTRGYILYHHENADGSGPFGKRGEEIPLPAHIIHLADLLDVNCHLQQVSPETYARIRAYLADGRDTLFTGALIDHFFRIMPEEAYLALRDQDINQLLDQELPHIPEEYTFPQVCAAMDVFGRIVDYKSPFTRNHSAQIARKLYRMAQEYGWGEETAQRLYVAGALHDIGKMTVANDVLEKPARLTSAEQGRMQDHAWQTSRLLSRIAGMEDIARWASRHHEKLDGKGYPFGLTGDALSPQDRLMTCVDIYQALREDRPYKKGLSHPDSMAILRDMAGRGQIDPAITEDLDRVFGS